MNAFPSDPSGSAQQTGIMQMSPELLNLVLQMQRSNAADTGGPAEMMTRGTWSESEDELLKSAVARLGAKKWVEVARFVPARTAKQCRERWFNGLCPEIKNDPFSAWEDALILEKQREFGNRWSMMARLLPGRSANAVKNRWYSGLRGANAAGSAPRADLGQPLYQTMPFTNPDDQEPGPSGNDL
jgi:hypothetical protein